MRAILLVLFTSVFPACIVVPSDCLERGDEQLSERVTSETTSSEEERARIAGSTILTSAIIHSEQNRGDTPLVRDLVNDGLINADQAIDPWGSRYRVEGAGANILVVSAGVDGEFGTGDDVVVGGRE